MTNYECYKCQKKFQQKGHLDNHLNRKRTCQKCNKNFKTDYAYIDKTPIHIKDYIEKNEKEKHKIKCNKGHSLVLVNGTKRCPYFRHKNTGDVGGNPMTAWHAEWQSKFPVTEICYPKKEGQIKDRRADIVIEKYNTIIEIQHSNIDEANVICRNNDYKLHHKELIWVVDGNTDDVKLEELSDGQFLIIFNKDWKYKSFSHTYDFILLDISEKIFKIPVKKVTTTMIKLKEYRLIKDVVSKLQTNPKKVWDLWEDDNSCKCNLIIWQQGAGNGKTYGLWKEIMENPDKETFIVLATKHSEKTVILHELRCQKERNEFHIIENVHDEEIAGLDDEDRRQYKLTYTQKTNDRKIMVIIATTSSFYYNLTYMDNNCSDPFASLVPNFINESASKINSKNGAFKFAGEMIYLNKKTQIWFDEAQDLHKNNIEAMTKLMLSYNVDIGVVGDKLQSLSYEENVFTVLDNINIQNVTIVRPKPTNINRRIKSIGLKDMPNEIILFSENNVPKISIENEDKLDKVLKPFEFLKFKDTIYSNSRVKENVDKIDKFCCIMVDKFEKEIKENNYLPQDFMIISPILSGRIELVELKSKLENMWIKLFNDDAYIKNISDDFWKENNHCKLKKPVEYVQLHRSEDGKSINLTESKMKTRIVSTVTSKGDGRKVVFCLNITERTLKLVSGNKIGLRYESHLHVPVTRAIRKVYFQLTQNGDDIHKRFKLNDDIYFTPNINTKFKINKLMDYIGDDKIAEMLATNGIEYKKETKDFDIKETIDFTDHCSRYATWKTLLYFYLNRRLKGPCYQTHTDLINNIPIGKPDSVREYWKILNASSKSPLEALTRIPLINYDNEYYKGFAQDIYDRMNKIKEKLQYENYKDIKSLEFTECDYLCLSYMLNINRYKKHTQFNINDLYSIINKIKINAKPSAQSFYSKIKPVEETCNSMIDSIEKKYGELTWNIDHAVSFEGNTDDFKIDKSESIIIGNNKDYVVDVIIKTTFSEINFFSVMKEILLNRFVIYKPEEKREKSKNKKRFANKKLVTYVLVLETNEYKEFNWDWDKCDEVKEIIKDGVESYFSSFHGEIFYFCNKICKNWHTDEQLKQIKTSPFNYIKKEFKKNQNTPPYIIQFIDRLEYEFTINNADIKNVINNEDIFIERIRKSLKKSINNFFDDATEFVF